MVGSGRRKSIAFFIALGTGLILVIILLYVGWVLLNWREGILLFLGILMVALIISGIVLNTIFLVREIRRNEQHDAFINAVTHELKTPVASIRLYIETLQTREVEESKRQDFYGIMLSDSERLLGMIEQILRTGRLDSSNRKPNLTPLNLSDVVEECVDRAVLQYHAPAGSIEFRSGGPLPIYADHDEVRAAVSNLIDNAVKYSGKDMKIEVESAERAGSFAEVRVKDHGAGIAQTELKRIFKRFYRITGPMAPRVKGTGLGLYIVRSVAKRHSGRAWAESAGPGQGSTFVVQFPLTRAQKTAEMKTRTT